MIKTKIHPHIRRLSEMADNGEATDLTSGLALLLLLSADPLLLGPLGATLLLQGGAKHTGSLRATREEEEEDAAAS